MVVVTVSAVEDLEISAKEGSDVSLVEDSTEGGGWRCVHYFLLRTLSRHVISYQYIRY